MDPLRKTLKEIHRRSLWQTVGIYLGASWLVLEAVGGIAEASGLPEWLPSFALILLMIGFPIILATAFVQVGAPEGDSLPATESMPENLAMGTGSLDRPTTRPPLVRRVLTWRNVFMGGVFAFALWGVVAAGGLLLGGWGEQADERDLRSVAVLPFAVRGTGQPNEAAFADGIHDDILTQLAKIADLKVISRTSVMAFRDPQRNMKEIGAALGVATLLEGGVQWDGQRVRINVQLIDAETDEHLWAETYDRELLDMFEVQSEIAARVAQELHAVISPEEVGRIGKVETASAEAYQLVRQAAGLDYTTLEGLDERVDLYSQAIELDPAYGLAYANLANTYRVSVQFHARPNAWLDSAIVAVDRAIEIDPDMAAAHMVRGWTLWVKRDLTAEASFRRAIEINPNGSFAFFGLSAVEFSRANFAEALYWATRAAILDPMQSSNHAFVAVMEGFLQRPERVRAALARAEMDPTPDTDFYRTAVGALLLIGDVAGARALQEDAKLVMEGTDVLANEVWVLWMEGDAGAAAQVAARLFEMSPDGVGPTGSHAGLLANSLYAAGQESMARDVAAPMIGVLAGNEFAVLELAGMQLITGDRDGALASLRRAQEAGVLMHPIGRGLAPWTSLAGDPAYEAILQDIDRDWELMRQRADARLAELGR